ncbi:hypothetical protein [Snodgrassella sp.]|nr:hypothetical protein [Snodgrassella sp.]
MRYHSDRIDHNDIQTRGIIESCLGSHVAGEDDAIMLLMIAFG